MADSNAKHYIDRALQKILVKQSGIDVTEDEYTDGIASLNDLMEELEVDFKLGYQVVVDKFDLVAIPDWAKGYVIAQLAVDLASEYGKQISQTLALEADRRRTSLAKRAMLETPFEVYMPETLPRGTTTMDNEHFYENPIADDVDTDTDAWIDEDGTAVEERSADV